MKVTSGTHWRSIKIGFVFALIVGVLFFSATFRGALWNIVSLFWTRQPGDPGLDQWGYYFLGWIGLVWAAIWLLGLFAVMSFAGKSKIAGWIILGLYLAATVWWYFPWSFHFTARVMS